jgi:hypothetical protein
MSSIKTKCRYCQSTDIETDIVGDPAHLGGDTNKNFTAVFCNSCKADYTVDDDSRRNVLRYHHSFNDRIFRPNEKSGTLNWGLWEIHSETNTRI